MSAIIPVSPVSGEHRGMVARLLQALQSLRFGFFLAMALVLTLASVALSFLYFKDVPLLQDGGWYTYPSYALSRGGDPSENVPGAQLPSEPRVTATFLWENRSNLVVPLYAAWFKLAPPSWWSLRVFGALQMALLAVVSAAVVWRVTGHRLLALTAFSLTASDSVLIAASLSNARPDVPIALTALLLLFAVLEVEQRKSWLFCLLALFLSVAVPLLHVTSAIAVAFFLAFLALGRLPAFGGGRGSPRGLVVGAVALLLTGSYLFRQRIMDTLLTTSVPPALEALGQHRLTGKLAHIVADGLGAKIAMESERWLGYFFVGNSAHFAFFVVIALSALLVRGMPKVDAADRGEVGRRCLVSVLCAAAVQLCIDPHGTSGHLIVLAVLGYTGGCLFLHERLVAGHAHERRVMPFLAGILIVAVCLKLGHAASIYRHFERVGLTNEAVVRLLDTHIPRDRDITVVGPAELWPYLADRRQRLNIRDLDRVAAPDRVDRGIFGGASYLLINEDYFDSGWHSKILAWQRRGLITRLASLGECGSTVACLAVYRIDRFE